MCKMSEKKVKKIGLTGVMGAGKSSVIQILKEMQIPVFDCDAINRTLLEKGNKGYQALVERYGNRILKADGEIDKKAMSDRMFEMGEKQQIEQILHPLIKKELQEQMDACSSTIAVAEVPLLFEIGWQTAFDETWVVACKEELLLQRLKAGRGVDEKEALRRLSAQLPQKEKIALCDVVLYNDADKEALRNSVLQQLAKVGEGKDESRR